MKIGHWGAFPLFVSLLFSGCVTQNPSTAHQAIPPYPESSRVSEKILREYPPSRYLYGIGQADSEQAAIELARADLAKKIRVRVTAAASDHVRAQGEQTDQLLGRLVTTQANELMNGTQVVDLIRDTKSGVTQAVVIVPKVETDPLNLPGEGTNASNSSLVTSLQSADPIWVTAESSVPFGADTTLGEAAARSRYKARRQAVERAVGTFVKGQTIVYNTTVTADMVRSIVRGIIIEEEILEEGVRTLGQHTDSVALFYVTKLRAKVQPVPYEQPDGLRLNVELNRTVFHEGDNVQIAIVPSQDAYVYILNVGQDDSVTMVFPNKVAHDNFLSAQREFVFPDDMQRKMGIRLRTALPPGEGKSIEKVKVLATSKRLGFSKEQQTTGSFFKNTDKDQFLVTDLMKRLALLEDTVWTETTIPYEIRR
jgi:hypothetical protein